MYIDQRATVLTDVESDEFRIARGTKQADPLSSLLFHSVLRSAVEKEIETWKDNGLGIKPSDEKRDCIPNLRFPDHMLMMASSLEQLKKCSRISKSTETQGREIHPSKIKIPTNQKTNKLREFEIVEMHVKILLLDGKYLGQMITFVDQETTEGQHRIRCAWSAFTKHRQGLTSQSHSTSTPITLVRRCCRTYNNVQCQDTNYNKRTRAMLRTTQRRMLRLIIQTERKYKNIKELGEETFVTTK